MDTDVDGDSELPLTQKFQCSVSLLMLIETADFVSTKSIMASEELFDATLEPNLMVSLSLLTYLIIYLIIEIFLSGWILVHVPGLMDVELEVVLGNSLYIVMYYRYFY